jgi:dTDP-4-dehydrorhamnose 3,5-epimerase
MRMKLQWVPRICPVLACGVLSDHKRHRNSDRERMEVIKTELPGVLVLKPEVLRDARGFFIESYNAQALAGIGISDRFVQDNHSCSRLGTLRGLHYQLRRPQAKLCRVVVGEVFDVALDIRRGSPTFGQWSGMVLSAENCLQLYIPAGFAHGFLVRSPTAEFLYKCGDYYDPASERGVLWNDPELNIPWGSDSPLLSARDRANPPLSQIAPDQLPQFGR